MHRQIIIFGSCLFVLCLVLALTTAWMETKTAVASAAAEQPVLEKIVAPAGISDATAEVSRFFGECGYDGSFRLLAAMRDLSLGRRYYRLQIPAEHVNELRQRLAHGWTWGHFNQAVNDNTASSRLPRSRNLPGWWQEGRFGDTTMMLDHGGKPNWYLVLCRDGEIDLMWVAY